MIELARIVEDQANLNSYRATENEEQAEQVELLIELTKPKNLYNEWDKLIATPFRYSPPFKNARFRSPYGKNIFYASFVEDTSFYEHAFHFIKERIHLPLETETGQRTLFFVTANKDSAIEIHDHLDFSKIMDKNNYSASHHFIENNPTASFIIYPSCRDPQNRNNTAIIDIHCLSKKIHRQKPIKFFYDNKNQKLTWIDQKFHITWNEVK